MRPLITLSQRGVDLGPLKKINFKKMVFNSCFPWGFFLFVIEMNSNEQSVKDPLFSLRGD